LKEKIKEFQHLRESKSNETSIHKNELNQLNKEFKSQENFLNELQSLMQDLNEKREHHRKNILVYSEKVKGSILTIDRLVREKSNNFKKIESLKQLSLDFIKEMTRLEPSIEEYLKIYKSKKEDLTRIEKEHKKKVNDLDLKQNERWELKRKAADDNSLYERTLLIIEEKQNEQKKIRNTLEILEKQRKELLNSEKWIKGEPYDFLLNMCKNYVNNNKNLNAATLADDIFVLWNGNIYLWMRYNPSFEVWSKFTDEWLVDEMSKILDKAISIQK